MHLLRKRHRRIIIRQLPISRRVARPQANPIVHIEDTRRPARRPHHGRRLHIILLRVHLAVDQRAPTRGAHPRRRRLPRVLREVVARQEVPCDALVQTRPPVVRRGYDGILEAAWVLEVEVELAGAGVLLCGDARADVGLELVEAVGYDLVVVVNYDFLDEGSFEALGAVQWAGELYERGVGVK